MWVVAGTTLVEKLVENHKCGKSSSLKIVFPENDPKMTLKATRLKVPHICSAATPRVPNFSPLTLRSLGFQKLMFLVSLMVNLKFSKKNHYKSRNQNFQKSQRRFVRTTEKKIQDKFENFWLRFVGEVK